jgi:5-methylcytosine-specific restriction endonuclease McrA
MSIITKKCSKCGEEKSIDQFHKQAKGKDGHRGKCKVCRSIDEHSYHVIYRETHRSEILKIAKDYRSRNKDKIMFYKKTHKEQIAKTNKEWYLKNIDVVRIKNRERTKQYRIKYPEKRRESERKWRENNHDHIRILGNIESKNYNNRKRGAIGKYTTKEWEQLCEKYNNVCLCCGQIKQLEADHIIPISVGGDNFITNIQPLCRSCNARKHNKTIDYRPMESL